MRKKIPVVIYAHGQRQIIGEATVDAKDFDGINLANVEINLNNAGLSYPIFNEETKGYSIGYKERTK